MLDTNIFRTGRLFFHHEPVIVPYRGNLSSWFVVSLPFIRWVCRLVGRAANSSRRFLFVQITQNILTELLLTALAEVMVTCTAAVFQGLRSCTISIRGSDQIFYNVIRDVIQSIFTGLT
jgi:hypothetical protein